MQEKETLRMKVTVSVNRFLINLLLLINIFFALFPAWRGSILWNYLGDVDEYFSKWMYLLSIANLFICLCIILLERKCSYKYLVYLILLLHFFYIISIFYNGFKSGSLAIIGIPICYITLFVIISRYSFSKLIYYIVFLIFLFWSISPLIYLLFAPVTDQILLFTDVKGHVDTFGGFALHRNFYGFYSGITFLLVVDSKFNKLLKILFCVTLLLGFYISGSRTVFLVLFITLFFFVFSKKLIKSLKYVILLAFFIIIGTVSYFFLSEHSVRNKGLNDNEDRLELIYGFWDIFKQSPIFGNGEPTYYYSNNYQDGSPAHNFVLQVMVDYGIVVAFLFLSFLFLFYLESCLYVRLLLVYLTLFGFFQPYFIFGIPTSFVFLSILVGYLLESKNQSYRICNYEKKRYYYNQS